MVDIDIEKIEISKNKLEEIKSNSISNYNKIGSVKCPHLKCDVFFNSKGIEHLKFKDKNKPRSRQDQYIRFKLLPLAEHIIKNSHTIQEYYETKKFERQKINSRWEQRMMDVCYYGFIAIINNARIKIIVKEINGGNKFFYSIIPFWRNGQKNCVNKKILHAGNLETD